VERREEGRKERREGRKGGREEGREFTVEKNDLRLVEWLKW
jgi:hypothetical protein